MNVAGKPLGTSQTVDLDRFRLRRFIDELAGTDELETHTAPIDLLFTDVVMPRMSGSELAAEARRMQPGVKVLYTSGYTRNAVDHNGRLDPGVEMIAKPFTFEGLAQKVRDVLDSGDGSVLVVDENRADLEIARKALSQSGFHSEIAATATEALASDR